MSINDPALIRIQLPTGKTAYIKLTDWLDMTDDQVQQFFENDHGSEVDPLITKYTEDLEDE